MTVAPSSVSITARKSGTNGPDGVRRLYRSVASTGTHLRLLVGVSETKAYAAARAGLRRTLLQRPLDDISAFRLMRRDAWVEAAALPAPGDPADLVLDPVERPLRALGAARPFAGIDSRRRP